MNMEPNSSVTGSEVHNTSTPLRPTASRFHYWNALADKLKHPSRYDYYKDYIRRHAAGARFIDVGGMWLVNGAFSFFAEECGAKEVVLLDVMDPTGEFLRTVSERNSKVQYRKGDLMDQTLPELLGQFDVVFCCGVVYHLPNPVQGICNIKALTRNKALIGSAIIPEGITRNRAVYFPGMDALSRLRWNFMARKQQAALAPYVMQHGYVNWFWGMSASCLESMIFSCGLAVEKIHYRLHFAFFECRL